MKVKDAMTASVVTISPDASLKEAAAILAEHAIGALPVLDGDGSVQGIVTEADILLKEHGESPQGGLRTLLHRDEVQAIEAKVTAHTVGDAMSAPAITVEAERSLALAAGLMLDHGLNRLPVVERGELVGIVTRHDLVRAFARSDSELERDIREEAFSGITWTEDLELTVKDGEVVLRGEIDSKYDAEAVPDRIRAIPGVVSVDSELSAWDLEGKKKVLVSVHRD
jgi:CBS domain-containing protein